MKNEFDYNVSPLALAIVATILTLLDAIFSDFGRARLIYRGFGRGELCGTAFIIGFLVVTIFYKGYRQYVWTKKGLITLFVALAINLAIAIYCIINHYNLYGYFGII